MVLFSNMFRLTAFDLDAHSCSFDLELVIMQLASCIIRNSIYSSSSFVFIYHPFRTHICACVCTIKYSKPLSVCGHGENLFDAGVTSVPGDSVSSDMKSLQQLGPSVKHSS